MRKPNRVEVAIAGLLLLASAQQALPLGAPSAAAASSPWPEAAPEGSLRAAAAVAPVLGPSGWFDWCLKDPGACVGPERAVAELDAERLPDLAAAHAAVMKRITPRRDPTGLRWSVVERPGAGDCKQYALTFRHELVARGWPRGALELAVAWTERGEAHAVLAVATDRGTWILDNRAPRPVDWRDLPYRWLMLEVTGTATWRLLATDGTS
jgi:predicted transglutaminase-like cysteine proteinase